MRKLQQYRQCLSKFESNQSITLVSTEKVAGILFCLKNFFDPQETPLLISEYGNILITSAI